MFCAMGKGVGGFSGVPFLGTAPAPPVSGCSFIYALVQGRPELKITCDSAKAKQYEEMMAEWCAGHFGAKQRRRLVAFCFKHLVLHDNREASGLDALAAYLAPEAWCCLRLTATFCSEYGWEAFFKDVLANRRRRGDETLGRELRDLVRGSSAGGVRVSHDLLTHIMKEGHLTADCHTPAARTCMQGVLDAIFFELIRNKQLDVAKAMFELLGGRLAVAVTTSLRVAADQCCTAQVNDVQKIC